MKLIPLASIQFMTLNHLATNILTSGIRLVPGCEELLWGSGNTIFPKRFFLYSVRVGFFFDS